MKLIMILLLMTTYVSAKGRATDPLPKYSKLKAPVVCMNGVAYYYIKSKKYSMMLGTSYAHAFLAPVIDSGSLEYLRCGYLKDKSR